jgi:hypothetical protein
LFYHPLVAIILYVLQCVLIWRAPRCVPLTERTDTALEITPIVVHVGCAIPARAIAHPAHGHLHHMKHDLPLTLYMLDTWSHATGRCHNSLLAHPPASALAFPSPSWPCHANHTRLSALPGKTGTCPPLPVYHNLAHHLCWCIPPCHQLLPPPPPTSSMPTPSHP